ncbi:DNA polymerase III subunit delta' [Candidatus Karelsulcia muelleri]|uniref:DNA polymerase III subunit delta' n=1 Tax=Candidatus Karelsulcia muelleri TaxID=336810 RepID=UPI00194E5348|nr:DNA polymerase III subunit delta' [Candidatus Karelsulcia muelleri]
MKLESLIEHEKIKAELYNFCKFNRLPTGILLLGPEGCGKLKLGIKFLKKLLKIEMLAHPDIQFLFPLPNLPKQKSNYFYNKWHNFLVNQPYGSLLDWKKKIHYENKDCKISLEQVEAALKMINLKSYELSHKVVIFWMLEHLTIQAGNKLLNVLDSPPKRVFFLFIGENENLILPTLKSRLLIIKLKLISNKIIEKYLIRKFHLYKNQAQTLVAISAGNLNTIFKILKNKNNNLNLNFIFWMRMLFNLNHKIDAFLRWGSQINSWNRDKKKSFLLFSLEIFRIAHRYKYDKNYINPFFYYKNFNWKQFCRYINTKKVRIINHLISDVIKGIDRYYFFLFNFLDLSFNMKKILFNK